MGFRVTGVPQVKRAVEGAKARTRDLTPVLTSLADEVKLLIEDAFDGSHSPDGSSWAALSPKTVAKRRRGSSKPLVDTNNLRNSVTTRGFGTTLSFGSNVAYARPHQMGFTRSGQYKRRMYNPRREKDSPWSYSVPARPYLPVTPQFTLMNTGPAGEVWALARRMVMQFIATGEVR